MGMVETQISHIYHDWSLATPLLMQMHDDLCVRSAQLAAVCAEFETEPPNGVMTLRRIRGLEELRSLVEQCGRGEVPFEAVLDMARAVGRQP